MNLKLIGSTFIMTGTAIGAGMLALPLVSGAVGLPLALALLVTIWIVMTLTGLMVLEVCLALKHGRNNFHSMAKETLGPIGQVVAWIMVLVLLYALTAAYISGDASLLTTLLQGTFGVMVPGWINAMIFTVVFGGVVTWSTRAVDLLNRGLMSFKMIALIITIALLLPRVNVVNLASEPGHARYLWVMAPIFLTSFGFHTSIPSVVTYMRRDVKALRKIILWGAGIPMIVYVLWLLVTLGIIPLYGADDSFQSLALQHGSVGMLVKVIDHLAHSSSVDFGINLFSNIAMTTSFLGVSLGLFDFLADGFKRPNSRQGRVGTSLMTFLLPLAFAIFYPKGFIAALGFAAFCVAVLEVIMPPLMVYQLRRSDKLHSPYRLIGGHTLLLMVLLVGVVLALTELADRLSLLPTFH